MNNKKLMDSSAEAHRGETGDWTPAKSATIAKRGCTFPDYGTDPWEKSGFSTPWKNRACFSTVWKNFFHSVENAPKKFPWRGKSGKPGLLRAYDVFSPSGLP
ncbi:MAG: hypothetical protein PHU50_07085 [Kiritimatiellae bacterium]|nr:hypothetical protein [Kiritimatiellia bacterium]